MVLLLDNLAVFNAKCVEDVKRLAFCEANLGLPAPAPEPEPDPMPSTGFGEVDDFELPEFLR